MKYYGLYTFRGSNHVYVLHDADGKVIVAEDPLVMKDVLDKLKDDGIIQTAQVAEAFGEPF